METASGNQPTIDADEPGVFYDVEFNQPLKFHIQKDLRGEIIQWLEQMITDNGGQVLRQVPLNGYVLIDPTSERGQKLARKWSDDAKPNRQVVCWTFVPGSVTAGNRLSAKAMQGVVPIFLNQGIPIGFTLDDNLGQNLIGELRLKITKYGGNLVKKYSEARVILTNDTKPSFEVLLERFRHDNDTYVEPPSWFDRCIAFGRYEHAAPPPKIVGGRRPGASRNEYCAEDDQLLAEYIATRIPSNDMRGRTGNGLYKELCERVDLYPWATRHPWNSWRNRYKTKRDRLDQMIDEWLEENPQPTDGKGQYIIKLTKALAEHEDQHGSSRVSTGDPGGSVAAGKRQKKDINEDPGSERRAWKRTKSMSLDMQEDEDNAEVEEVMDAEALMLNHLSKVATAPSI
ncbi:hypothetical protein FRB93_001675 [Tulasnella sp. JGI-2019a]|nr:hypothetical protein FRB93_001675 [Tulasnella sp. JGI-2019a]